MTSEYVFTYAAHSFSRVDRAFHGALSRAGIDNVRFHDLRHTFAGHLVMRGAGIKEVQGLLGHEAMTMTLRYAHLSEEHKREAVNLLKGLTAGCFGTEMPEEVTSCLPQISASANMMNSLPSHRSSVGRAPHS